MHLQTPSAAVGNVSLNRDSVEDIPESARLSENHPTTNSSENQGPENLPSNISVVQAHLSTAQCQQSQEPQTTKLYYRSWPTQKVCAMHIESSRITCKY